MSWLSSAANRAGHWIDKNKKGVVKAAAVVGAAVFAPAVLPLAFKAGGGAKKVADLAMKAGGVIAENATAQQQAAEQLQAAAGAVAAAPVALAVSDFWQKNRALLIGAAVVLVMVVATWALARRPAVAVT